MRMPASAAKCRPAATTPTRPTISGRYVSEPLIPSASVERKPRTASAATAPSAMSDCTDLYAFTVAPPLPLRREPGRRGPDGGLRFGPLLLQLRPELHRALERQHPDTVGERAHGVVDVAE